MRKTKSEQNLKKIFKNSILLENCNKIKSEFTFFAIFFILQIQPDFVGRNRDTDREAGRQTDRQTDRQTGRQIDSRNYAIFDLLPV